MNAIGRLKCGSTGKTSQFSPMREALATRAAQQRRRNFECLCGLCFADDGLDAGHDAGRIVTKCPLMSAKQTFRHKVATSVFDPKRTWRTSAVMLD